MPDFQLVADFGMMGDQEPAVERLSAGVHEGMAYQTLLGVTGSGKTFTMANIVQEVQRPTIVIAHNKTLAAQLATEFKEFFPHNAVEYFVSYYDYYQPEAYIPRTDTYIEKDSSINEELDKLRLASTTSLLTRRDTLIVASVSCIYGLGDPSDYFEMVARIEVGQEYNRRGTTPTWPGAVSQCAATPWRLCPPMKSSRCACNSSAMRSNASSPWTH